MGVRFGVCMAAVLIGSAGVASAQRVPVDGFAEVSPRDALPVFRVPDIDFAAVAAQEASDLAEGLPPTRYAMPYEVEVTPDTHGAWEPVSESMIAWRMRVVCENAMGLNFGFKSFELPQNSTLTIYDTDGDRSIRPFTEADNDAHGELWTPPLVGNDVIIELVLPVKELENLDLELGVINTEYRRFGDLFGDTRSGACNIDVICPEGDDWQAEIQSVAGISTGGSLFCTGFMVNNTAQDQTPYFMTANHCGINAGNAPSLVVVWNFETTECEGTPDGSLSDFQTGSVWRASRSASDFTLVELDDTPNPDSLVAFAGWDVTGDDTDGAVAIHHPSGDEKRISFEYDPTDTTGYLGGPGSGTTHVRVFDWDLGTTEPGSSGSPLFDFNHRVIGQLHGGFAACGNDDPDWYGKMSVSWDEGGSNSSSLVSWLDPINTGQETLDTLWPGASGILVTGNAYVAQGDTGGPFSPPSNTYTIRNMGDISLDYTVSADVSWLSLSTMSGTIPAGAEVDVTVQINSVANSFGNGGYRGNVDFTNTTNGDGSTTKAVQLFVGIPQPIYVWNMDTNPGWDTTGQWAFGRPTGGGGQYGQPDPTSGATGSDVYGYNLNGDYTNNMPEYHLTTGAIDCSDLSRTSLRFQRHLNVEQPAYDHAYIRVSNDEGQTWNTVWENTSEVADGSWRQVEYDISGYADGQPSVYVRWTQGTTDGSWLYSGWNIDDVEIWAVQTEDDECRADFNEDGDVNTIDVIDFLNAWGAGDASADFNDDGDVNTIDVIQFLNAWSLGC